MTVVIQAILDRPTASSLGLVGLVFSDNGGRLRVAGVHGSHGAPIAHTDFDDLVRDGHAFRVDPFPVDLADQAFAALWIGNEFAEHTEFVGLRMPPIPQQSSACVSTGTFWVAPSRHVWRVLDSWIIRAFRNVVNNRSEDIAKLMTWVMPDRSETRAARWLTSPGTEARTRSLEWWARLEHDRGNSDVTPTTLEFEFSRLAAGATNQPKVVVGLSAPARGGDKEIAAFVATKTGLPQISFGGWLKNEARAHGLDEGRLRLQHLGNDFIQKRGELGLCLHVLDDIVPSLPNTPFVIEGIRHLRVLESVQTLVGPERFVLAYVDRPIEERRNLLTQEDLTADQVEQVLTDPTEAEIPEVAANARITLDMGRHGGGEEVEGMRLIKEAAV